MTTPTRRMLGLAAIVCTLVLGPGAGTTGAQAGGDSVDFAPTGSVQPFTVPDDVCTVEVAAVGGLGGNDTSGASRGLPGGVDAQLTVTPGETLDITVGSNGSTGSLAAGGWPDGGDAGIGVITAGSGGGSSSVSRGGTRLVVAGGGGGAGAGSAGGDGGQQGADGGNGDLARGGASGGNGGAGGEGADADNSGGSGTSDGQGGDGYAGGSFTAGGGGGGGDHGGGAGGSSFEDNPGTRAGGGGGGSSSGPSGASFSDGVAVGSGSVHVEWTVDPGCDGDPTVPPVDPGTPARPEETGGQQPASAVVATPRLVG